MIQNSKNNIGFRFETDSQHATFMCGHLGVTTTDLDESNEVLNLIQQESERGMVLLAASLFDVRLEKLAKVILQYGNSDLKDDIVGFPGPLSSFSSRIKLLYSMGVLDKDTYTSLNIIRVLRNICAHAPKDFKFDNSAVWSEIVKIPLSLQMEDEDPEGNVDTQLKPTLTGKKTQFQLKVGVILLNLMGATKSAERIAQAARSKSLK